jgi:hypothetical protein
MSGVQVTRVWRWDVHEQLPDGTTREMSYYPQPGPGWMHIEWDERGVFTMSASHVPDTRQPDDPPPYRGDETLSG